MRIAPKGIFEFIVCVVWMVIFYVGLIAIAWEALLTWFKNVKNKDIIVKRKTSASKR